MSDFDTQTYMQRIGLAATPSIDANGLSAVTRAQGYAIPFENFDVLLGRTISLEPQAIFDKLVRSPRGGYCFELNNLLRHALQHFGFDVRPLLARVHLRGEPTSRTHQLLLVTIDNAHWLADVGFGGGGLLEPIPLQLDTVFEQDGLHFQLVRDATYEYMLQMRSGDHWQNVYSLDLGHVGQADIEAGHYYTSTHPQCFFTYSRIATIPIEGGRISLKDYRIRKQQHGANAIITLPDSPEYLEMVKQYFNIDIQAPYETLKPVPE